MGIIDDIGTIPLKMAEEFYKKGYFIWILLGGIVVLIWLWGK